MQTNKISTNELQAKARGANKKSNSEARGHWFHQTRPTPILVANIVLVKKKKEQRIQMLYDFRDLNKAYSTDEFPLSNIDMLVDGIDGHSMFSFLDDFRRYSQIKMDSSYV